ncbi:MAG: VWA domain-containing protein [Bacteroidetes bacterium]|nr:VWA domain-containing protein [Bacteroidota bacterium]
MKKIIFLFVIISFLVPKSYSNGVAIVNASTGVYFRLLSSTVYVSTEGQISVTRTTLVFKNNMPTDTVTKFAFPLPDGASATNLRWLIEGIWHEATITPNPQDTLLPGGPMNTNLRTHLGSTPLFFGIPQRIQKDSLLTVELTYVQLLQYSFGSVYYIYPDDYHLIQTMALSLQRLDFYIRSPRTIDSIMLQSSHPLTSFYNNGDSAYVQSILNEAAATQNYKIKYSLNLNQLGLYAYSTRLPNSQIPDTLGGFFTFIAEPDPGSTQQTIKKVFTLMVDRSGSMSGTKMEQAKQAAVFIVQNLNEGDRFNVIDFDDVITAFRGGHVNYTNQTRDSAIIYINALYARNNTSISGAFGLAVPQFNSANDSTANIIIFLTDGQPTAGITDITQLLAYVHNLIVSTETNIYLYCFGIGSDVNTQLLTPLSAQNNGITEYLGNDEVYSRISSFYLKIRNPVLLSPTVTFNPNNVIQVYPSPLPNLYKGQQMIVSGRYLQPGPVTVTLSGKAFNHNVSYQYSFNRIDTANARFQFLTKIWAKQKIDNLLIQYYALNPNSPEALALKAQIIWLSINYGVISPFTQFNGGITFTPKEGNEHELSFPGKYKLTGNYPNPFNPETVIKFAVKDALYKVIHIRIYNILGQLVADIPVAVNGKGMYEVKWNSLTNSRLACSSGIYFYTIDFGDEVLKGKMMLLK